MNGFLPQMPRVAAIGDTAIRLHLRNLPSTAINQERPACQRVARQAIVPVPLLTAMPGSPGRPPQRRGQPQTDQGLTRAGVRDHGPGLRLAGQCTDADRFRFLPVMRSKAMAVSTIASREPISGRRDFAGLGGAIAAGQGTFCLHVGSAVPAFPFFPRRYPRPRSVPGGHRARPRQHGRRKRRGHRA